MLAALRVLLSSPSFDPNRRNSSHDTLLLTAARCSHRLVVDLLLSSCPTLELDLTTLSGWTAVLLAARAGDRDTVRTMVGWGADTRALREALDGRGENSWLVKHEHRAAMRDAVEDGLRRYSERLHAVLSERGVTCDAYLPHELQSLVIAYVTGVSSRQAAP